MINELFKEPTICAIIGDTNTGKSNLLYNIIEEAQLKYDFQLHTFGLRIDNLNAININSIEELERIKNSFIIIDEFDDLFDLDDRHKKKQIERTLRLLFHNNNIIILSGLPENFKKFISAKVKMIIYKQVTFDDFINGSRVKKKINYYSGEEVGSSILNIKNDECLIYDGLHYRKHSVPYLEAKDTKKNNVDIFVKKSVPKNVENLQ